MEFNYVPKYPVQTVQKAIDVLLCIQKCDSPDGMTIGEINDQLDLGKSVVHRVLDTLYAYRFVEKTEKSGAYRLGWGLYELAQVIPEQHSLNEGVYRKAMNQLCTEFQETVNLGIYNNGEVVIIRKIEPDRRVRSNIEVGEREPLYATALGKQFLAAFDQEEVDDYLHQVKLEKLTARTIVEVPQIHEELERVRKQGYSIDDREFSEDLICTAVPIHNFQKHVVAAISVSVPENRYTEEKGKKIVAALKAAAEEISNYLGF